jgi:hypothetical protein
MKIHHRAISSPIVQTQQQKVSWRGWKAPTRILESQKRWWSSLELVLHETRPTIKGRLIRSSTKQSSATPRYTAFRRLAKPWISRYRVHGWKSNTVPRRNLFTSSGWLLCLLTQHLSAGASQEVSVPAYAVVFSFQTPNV